MYPQGSGEFVEMSAQREGQKDHVFHLFPILLETGMTKGVILSHNMHNLSLHWHQNV